jgi:hypothetical protein
MGVAVAGAVVALVWLPARATASDEAAPEAADAPGMPSAGGVRAEPALG